MHTGLLKQINLYYFALLAFAVIGIYARFKGIATWPISEDEYHTVASINNVLEHGLPYFDCGGFYSRGILYQYLLAFLSYTFGGDQIFLYRTANALISLLALPAIYMLAKKLSGKEAAILAVIFYMVSIWEVEYARLIRMYIPFQVMFIWYIYTLYKVTIENDLGKLKYLLILSTVSVFVFEEGILLTVINLAVLAFINVNNYKRKIVWVYALFALAIPVAALIYLQIDFRHMDVQNYLPIDAIIPEYSARKNTLGPLLLPTLLLPHIINHEYWFGAWSILGAFTLAGLAFTTRFYKSWLIFISASCVAVFAALNLFTLAILSVATFYLLSWLKSERSLKTFYLYLFLTGSAYCLLWLSFMLNTDTLSTIFNAAAEGNLKKALVVLLKYPNFYDKIIYQWFGGMPVFTTLTAIIISMGIALDVLKKREINIFINQTLIVLLLISTMVAISLQPYHSSRYTFLLHPIVIILLVYYLHKIIYLINFKKYNNIVLLAIASCLLFISDDHVFNYLTNIDSKKINFKIGFTPARKFHLRNRMDFESPADYINANRAPSDLTVTTIRPVSYYLNKLDYYYITPEDFEFSGVSACNGEKELWTNASLLYSDDMLKNLLSNRDQTIWLTMRSAAFPYPSSMEKQFHKAHKSKLVYLSIDDSIAVYRFEKL
ncbi:hypothetical protein MNBD_GAMMA05-1887 [hydrothermal vent metagenome]|uniref:Glycosyltransferase RgtA/B/C/D-like domain-containing protein n=1 Tax=hydrothermal vent metagenome TaxID=652676 RepID=A0A3B0WAJ0_9ZZZZ